MVVEVEVRHNDSYFLSCLPEAKVFITINEDQVNDDQRTEMNDYHRDMTELKTTCYREKEIDMINNTCCTTANTTVSILNITEDDDDDEDNDNNEEIFHSFFFDDEVSPAGPLNQSFERCNKNNRNKEEEDDHQDQSPQFMIDHYENNLFNDENKHDDEQTMIGFANNATDTSTSSSSTTNNSLLDTVTESFVEALCFPMTNNSTTIPGSCTTSNSTAICLECNYCSGDAVEAICCHSIRSSRRRQVLEQDLLVLLGCSKSPSQHELNEVWFVTSDFFPCSQQEEEKDDNDNQQQQQQKQQNRLRHRVSNQERTMRIHRLYTEIMLPRKTTNKGLVENSIHLSNSPPLPSSAALSLLSPSPKSVPISRARSMDDNILKNQKRKEEKRSSYFLDPFNVFPFGDNHHEELESKIKRDNLDPILPSPKNDYDDEYDFGYDSDPGELSLFHDNNNKGLLSRHEHSLDGSNCDDIFNNPLSSHYYAQQLNAADERIVDLIVQGTLNSTWKLKWFPSAASPKNPFGHKKSVFVNVWLERGTLVHNNKEMLEPCIMWRETYKSTTTTPHRIRLMDLCRILGGDASTTATMTCSKKENDLLNTKYPLARTSCCIWLKTCNGNGEEFVFEAGSVKERDEILHNWKLVVARLASLAVMEDLQTIEDEFFMPQAECFITHHHHRKKK